MSEQRKETMSQVKIDKRLLNLGKRELARRLTESNHTAHTWINASIMIASELYLRCPSHDVFSNGTFAESTADMILKEAAKKVKDLDFDVLRYLKKISETDKFTESQFNVYEEITKADMIKEFQMLRYRMKLDKIEDPEKHVCDDCQFSQPECPAMCENILHTDDKFGDNILYCTEFVEKTVNSTPADKGESVVFNECEFDKDVCCEYVHEGKCPENSCSFNPKPDKGESDIKEDVI